MKQAYRLLAVLLSVVMLLSVVPLSTFTAFAETEGIFTYSVSNGKATIIGLVDINTIGAIEIPATIGGYPVTSIGRYAFSGCTGLTSITIPNSVTSIGGSAFEYCTGLTSITIPDSVTSIGDQAFAFCSGLTGIVIPDSVVSMGRASFFGCSGLTSAIISKNVTSIGEWAFDECSGLEEIRVNSGNPVYHSDDNCLIETKTKTLICGCKSSVIPTDGSVISIGDWAFYNCVGLTSITIPDSVTSIGEGAFSECVDLTDVYYNGSESDWDEIHIGAINESLTNATIHYALEPPHEHNYVEVITDPTCTQDGYVTVTCDCGDSFTAGIIPALGHDYTAVVTAPTYTEGGYTTYTCSRCGDSYVSDYTDPIQPDYIAGDINGDGEVNNKDLTRLFQYLTDWDVEVVEAALDINGDGQMDNRDLVQFLRYLSGWDVSIH